MASEDKTYCGQAGINSLDTADDEALRAFATPLGISTQDVLDAIEQVGNDSNKIKAFFKSKENSY